MDARQQALWPQGRRRLPVTLEYRAPELFEAGHLPTTSTDVYGATCVLYELPSGFIPHRHWLAAAPVPGQFVPHEQRVAAAAGAMGMASWRMPMPEAAFASLPFDVQQLLEMGWCPQAGSRASVQGMLQQVDRCMAAVSA
jgi:hypothetical protein